MIEKVLADYLESKGLGTVGSDIFVERLPESPDRAIAVLRYSGRAPVTVLSGSIVIEQPSIQVLVRSPSFAESANLIYQIRDLFTSIHNTNLENLYILGVLALGSPAVLERDVNNRVIMFCNFDTAYTIS